MKNNKLILYCLVLAALFVSCNKAHYDLDNVHGVNVEGEVLLPLAKGSFTVMDMMSRFGQDSVLVFDASGNMSYNYSYEHNEAIKGSELLKFNDLTYNEHFAFENPFPFVLPFAFDTVVRYEHQLTFEADHISVVEAEMRSGRFDFELSSNIGAVKRVVIRSSEIKDAQGHDLELTFPLTSNAFGFDLGGLHYETETPNALSLSYEVQISTQGSTDDELYLDIDIVGSDLAIKEMTGFVERYETRSQIDTAFNFFPGNLSGVLYVNDVNVSMFERNTFDLEARLDIDTITVFGEGFAPYSLFNPLPSVDLPTEMGLNEVFNQNIDGQLNASNGRIYGSSNFIINPSGSDEQVSVGDTCQIDIRVDVSIPMAFRISDVCYVDTVDMNIGQIEKPEAIKKLTLDLTFDSTIPFELKGRFLMYNSVTEHIAGVLLDETTLIGASYDGQPVQTSVTIALTENQFQDMLDSDRLILDLQLDTDGHDVVLKTDQRLQFFAKAKVEYDSTIELED